MISVNQILIHAIAPDLQGPHTRAHRDALSKALHKLSWQIESNQIDLENSRDDEYDLDGEMIYVYRFDLQEMADA